MISLFGKFSHEEFQAIPESELSRRISKLLTLEAVSGTLNELTSAEMNRFDESMLGE